MIHKNGNKKYGITKRDLPFHFIEGCHETTKIWVDTLEIIPEESNRLCRL